MQHAILLLTLFITELIYFRVAARYNIIDRPNERSSHTRITLRGGGIIFYIGAALFFLLYGFQYPLFFAGLSLIALISFADDIRPQSTKLRLLIHLSAMLLMFCQWDLFSFPWYYIALSLIICTGILNAFNFMDGINGITGGYSLIAMSALWYINTWQVHFADGELICTMILSLLVFVFFNFRKKAKCFAGDVGAISIAFVLVFLLGLLIIKTNDFSYIILLVVYGTDSILTIIHRLMLRENIFDAHRKHAYQLMANELKIPHVAVSCLYSLSQALITAGFILFFDERYLYLSCVIVVLSAGYILFMKKYFRLHANKQ